MFDDDLDHYNEYVRLCWEKDANLDSNILVSTIHGVKGMERDVVIINSDWGPMCYKFISIWNTEEQKMKKLEPVTWGRQEPRRL